MATLNIASVDQDATLSLTIRTRSFPFGDGYTQEVADGINNQIQVWQLNWTGRDQATIFAIDDFLRGQNGAWFFWTTPRGEALKFTCRTWAPKYPNSVNCSLSATLTQSFEP